MLIKHEEILKSDIRGTVIDIETIGEFERYRDSRRYKNLKTVIFGFLSSCELRILCAEGKESIGELFNEVINIINMLEKPFYGFNNEFERGVLFYNLDLRIDFEGELQKEKFEKKANAVRDLKIPNYDDPFFDDGYKCMNAWNLGDFTRAVAHNRACLLKERDILLKRKYRDSDKMEFLK